MFKEAMLILIFTLSLFGPSLTVRTILISFKDGISIVGLLILASEKTTSLDSHENDKATPSGSDDKEASKVITEPSKACHDGDQ